jgi:hypothetical protein
MKGMNAPSNKFSFVLLGITALLCSGASFWFFHDPEGPNLLVVLGTAVVLYVLSVIPYAFSSSLSHFTKLLLTILIQIILAAGFVFFGLTLH